MNPGLPGTGIGGLFYICSALLMPLCELRRRWRGGTAGQGGLVARQFAIALGVIASMSCVFWALDAAFMVGALAAHVAGLEAKSWSIALRTSALLTTTCVLVAVLVSVQIARVWLRMRGPRHAAR